MDILLAEDDEVARRTLAGILAANGWRVHEAADGEDAWGLLKAGLRPQVCCSDVQMPRLGGLELAERAARHPVWKRLPFVMISVSADPATVTAASAIGTVGYVLKPFVATQALATVDSVARGRRRERAEHYLVTSRRLGQDLGKLESRLETLAGRASLIQAERSLPSALQPECEELGLWIAAALAAEANAHPVHAADIARELHALVEDQLASLRNLEMPA